MTRRHVAWAAAFVILMTVVLTGAPRQTTPPPQQGSGAERQLEAAIHREQVLGDVKGAIEQYKQLAQSGTRAVAAQALVHLGQCYEKLGEAQARDARATYERVVRDYADQPDVVVQARARLAALGGPAGVKGLVARRILADAGSVRWGWSLTRDGKYICYIDGATGDVVQMEVSSGQTRRITNQGGAAAKELPYEHQAISRDGKQLAYDTYTKDFFPQLRIRNLDGSGIRTLYGEQGFDARPLDWSPDAAAILVFREHADSANGGIDLALISTLDGSVRVLRNIASARAKAEFSPDGRFVAFGFMSEEQPAQGDLHVMTADGRNDVVIAAHPGYDGLIGWAPDGKSLVFLSDRSGTWDVWRVQIAAGQQQGDPQLLMKDFGGDSRVLGVAPDGSLYYTVDLSSGRLLTGEVDLETGKVLVPPTPVATRYTGPMAQLSWSPDGRNLAYLSRPGPIGPGHQILTIRSAATGEERFPSPRIHGINQVSWAPDSRAVVALGFTAIGTEDVRIDTDTGAVTKLGVSGVVPKLLPDGKSVTFWNGNGGICTRHLETGQESEIVKGGPFYDLSPDGREVVFMANGAVSVASLAGGAPRELFRGTAPMYRLKWTRDGRNVIAEDFRPGNRDIWRIPAQGGTPVKLDLSIPNLVWFALHPDNRRFALSVGGDTTSELWVLENFLPPPKEKKQ